LRAFASMIILVASLIAVAASGVPRAMFTFHASSSC
jgi:hypothetical protein